MVGCEDTDDSADDPSGNKTLSFDVSSVSCSICLDFVIDSGNRSRAKLQCGHEFHLDCIGSAFNMKGAMQCPNCRKVERGRWLYAGGSTFSFPEFSIDDWTPDEDPYELSYSETPFRVHWCPFSGLGRVHSSFEEVESPSTTYHNVQRHHAIFADQHTAASSVAHSYVAYFGPIPPTSSNTHESVEGSPGHNEIFTAHTFPFIGIHYQSREHHSNPFSTNSGHVNSADQASVPLANLRSTRREYDAMTRSGSFMRPFLYGHGSARRDGSSFFSSIVHPSSNSRSQQRIPASHAIHHPQQPINPPGMPSPAIPVLRRFNGPRSLPPVVSAASQSDHSGSFFISLPPGSLGRNLHETQNSLPNHFPTWERDHTSPLSVISSDRDLSWASVHHAAYGGSDSRNRSGSFWHRH